MALCGLCGLLQSSRCPGNRSQRSSPPTTPSSRSSNTPAETSLRRYWTDCSLQTVLRSSNDPSMLVHAVIDVVVDMSLPIGKRVAEIFDHLERAVLHNPTIPQSKQLHILRSGLTLLLNNTNSIGGLVKTLCDHRAVADLHNTPRNPTNSQTNPSPAPASKYHPWPKSTSKTSKTTSTPSPPQHTCRSAVRRKPLLPDLQQHHRIAERKRAQTHSRLEFLPPTDLPHELLWL